MATVPRHLLYYVRTRGDGNYEVIQESCFGNMHIPAKRASQAFGRSGFLPFSHPWTKLLFLTVAAF